jgi:hypothetical protein
VVEHPETMNVADIDGVYSVYDRRKYGKSAVSFVQEDRK